MMNRLLQDLQDPRAYPVFVTGAGISIASGIPPFRGTPDAVWERSVLEKGTVRYFHRDPVKSWLWFLSTFDSCRAAKPNTGHTALANIERKLLSTKRRSLTITQNVDGLHKEAGTINLVECHGTVRHMRCTKSTCLYGPPTGMISWDAAQIAAFQADPRQGTLPRCSCGALLRMHVLWFDESYDGHTSYGMDTICNSMDDMTVVVFIGTSFSVSITDMMMTAAYQRAVPMFIVDPHSQGLPEMHLIQEPSETFLPALATELRI